MSFDIHSTCLTLWKVLHQSYELADIAAKSVRFVMHLTHDISIEYIQSKICLVSTS